jgi:predicted MFS family arabinose efflux permease
MTSRRAWLLVGFLGVALFLDNIDRHAIFSIFPVLKSKLHFTDVELGLTGSVFLWVYALCSPIAGQIGDRFSKKRLVALSLLLWSGATALTGLCNSPAALLACRALLGITESLFYPAAMALIANAHGPGTRSLAANLFGIGEYAGVAAGGWYGSFMAQEFDWRLVFFSLGLAGILYTFPYAAFLKGVPDEATAQNKPRESSLSVAVLVRVPSCWFLAVAFPVCVCVVWLLYTWFPTFLYEKFSLSLAEAGFSATVYLQSANLVGTLAGAALGDRFYSRTGASRFWVSAIGFFLAAPCFYMIGNSASLFLTEVAAIGVGLSSGMFLANLTVSSFDVIPAPTRASAVGCLNLMGSMTSGFASLAEGKWKQSMRIASMMNYSALACLGAGVLLIVCIRFYFQRDYERVH